MEIQLAADRFDIEALIFRYPRAVNTQDWKLWRSVFTKDVVVDHSSAGMMLAHVTTSPRLAQAVAMLPMTQHLITNIESEVRHADAQVRAAFSNAMQLPGKDDLSVYDHRLVRTADGWRSRLVREENEWFVNPLIAAEVPNS